MDNEQLVARIRAGEDVAENMSLLYVRNKGMIAKMAGKYQGHDELDDLMQEGYIGLCNAVDAYDSEGGASFLHYALFWIRQAMQWYLENCGSCIRIPASQLYKVRKYEKLKRQYLQEFGREPQDWELCRLLEVSYSALQQLKKMRNMVGYRALISMWVRMERHRWLTWYLIPVTTTKKFWIRSNRNSCRPPSGRWWIHFQVNRHK